MAGYTALVRGFGLQSSFFQVEDPAVKRKLQFLSNIGTAVLRPDILRYSIN